MDVPFELSVDTEAGYDYVSRIKWLLSLSFMITVVSGLFVLILQLATGELLNQVMHRVIYKSLWKSCHQPSRSAHR